MVIWGITVIVYQKKNEFPKICRQTDIWTDGHTDGKKVTPKDPLRINARDLKIENRNNRWSGHSEPGQTILTNRRAWEECFPTKLGWLLSYIWLGTVHCLIGLSTESPNVSYIRAKRNHKMNIGISLNSVSHLVRLVYETYEMLYIWIYLFVLLFSHLPFQIAYILHSLTRWETDHGWISDF